MRAAIVPVLAVAVVSVACSPRKDTSAGEPAFDTGSPETTVVDTGFDAEEGGLHVDAELPETLVDADAVCPPELEKIYTIDKFGQLSRFDPDTLSFSSVGYLDCPASSTPYSMAIDRSGFGWMVTQDGSLFRFDVKTAHCTATSYVSGQSGFVLFGMGFTADSPGSVAEHLYVSSSKGYGLATIDTKTLVLTPIADYDLLPKKSAELTGSGDGKLYGLFETSPWEVSEIDKTSAHILSQAPQTAITGGVGSYAFAFWGGDFWLFVGPGFSTDVYRYRPKDGTTTKVASTSMEILGAGVSTCAPTHPH